ncbi:MAG: PAS domain S-box protein [Chloroflexi bacterium]|nr:PAS domain S-box protein [Chloroflexota bacterium]
MDEHPLRILIVEDESADVELAQYALEKEHFTFDSLSLCTESAFVSALHEFQPDIIISDYSMPVFNGMRALELTLEHDPHLPFIVFTASRNEETAVACIKAGATDYVLKDCIARLPFAVREALKQNRIRQEKQAAEKALQESEERYRALFEQAGDYTLVMEVGSDGMLSIVDANQAALRAHGYTREELVGQPLALLDPQLSCESIARLLQVLIGNEPRLHVTQHQRKDGSWFDVEVCPTLVSIRDKQMILSVERDITERKRTERALQEQRDLLATIFDSSPSILMLVNEQARVSKINHAGAHFANRPIGEMVELLAGEVFNCVNALREGCGKSPDCGICPVRTRINQTFETGRSVFNETARLRIQKNGQVIPLDFLISTAKVDTSDGAQVLMMVTDISSLKRAEQQLIESEERFATIFHASPLSIALSRLSDKQLIDVNEAWENLTGWTRTEGIGRTQRELELGMSSDKEAELVEHLLVQHAVRDIEVQIQRKSGETANLLTSIGLVELAGEPCMLEIALDVTERKRAEQVAAARMRILHFSLTHALPEILQKVLDECEALTGSSGGFLHFLLSDQNASASQNWSTPMLKEFYQVENQGLHSPLIQTGVWDDCIRERRAIIVNDFAAIPASEAMPAGRIELRRFVSIPIMRGEKIVAIIGVGNKSTNYDERDVEVVTQLADLSWDVAERKRAEEALQTSELWYRALFENVAVPIWEEDFSKVKDHLTSLNVQDVSAYFDAHPNQLAFCAKLVEIISVNHESVRVFRVNHADEIKQHQITDYFVDGSWQVFKNEIVALWEGKMRFEAELPFLDSTGKIRYSLLRLSVVPGFENTLGRVLLSFVDITERKEMEETLSTLSRRLFEAQEAERRNVARELHDEIGQVLTAVKSNLQTSRMLTDRQMSANFLEESIGIVDQALRQVRDLSLNLRPALLDDFGLVPALEWYLNRQASRSNFVIEFAATPRTMKLPQTLAINCFRVAQSALTNIERHAQAKNVRVDLRVNHQRVDVQSKKSELVLTIVDDGAGFDTQAVLEGARHGNTLGIAGMQERVRLAGGQIEIHSRPRHGTQIIARFPIVKPKIDRRAHRRVQ